MIKNVLLTLFLILIGIIAFYGYRLYRLMKISEGIVARTVPYSLSGSTGGISLLVLGDSTAV